MKTADVIKDFFGTPDKPVSNKELLAFRKADKDGYDEIECPLPAVVSVTAGVVEPRYPSFKGIMAAKNKTVDVLDLAELGIDPGTVGWAGARQEITDIAEAPARDAGEIIVDEGDAHERILAFLDDLKVL